MHLVTDADLPDVPRARDGESVDAWRARLSPEAREFVAALEAAGLGPITNVEPLRGGGGAGAP